MWNTLAELKITPNIRPLIRKRLIILITMKALTFKKFFIKMFDIVKFDVT